MHGFDLRHYCKSTNSFMETNLLTNEKDRNITVTLFFNFAKESRINLDWETNFIRVSRTPFIVILVCIITNSDSAWVLLLAKCGSSCRTVSRDPEHPRTSSALHPVAPHREPAREHKVTAHSSVEGNWSQGATGTHYGW